MVRVNISNNFDIIANHTFICLVIVLGLTVLACNFNLVHDVAASENATEYKVFKKWGGEEEGDGRFRDPEHLAIDSDGNVYVSDRKNENIQVFAPRL